VSREYDFLHWTSFPSSRKIINYKTDEQIWWTVVDKLPVEPGKYLTVVVNVKGQNIGTPAACRSHIAIDCYNENYELFKIPRAMILYVPPRTTDWTQLKETVIVPNGAVAILVTTIAGTAQSPDLPNISWYDDLKIYQNGELIYENTFDNWLPCIIGGGITTVVVGVAGVTKLMKVW